jgi:hypothetical protein
MCRIRIEDRRDPRVGAHIVGTTLLLVLLVVIVCSVAAFLHGPSHTELVSEEAAARQQAALDSAWRPWVTGATNLAGLSVCLAVPIVIGLSTYMGIRRIHEGCSNSRAPRIWREGPPVGPCYLAASRAEPEATHPRKTATWGPTAEPPS